MAIKTNYDHGQFSWVDLSSHDMNAAKGFYGSVFGWSCDEMDTEGGPHYAGFKLEGKSVCGLGQMPEEVRSQGVPPLWNSYVNVDDIRKVVARVEEHGGKVTVPVMQVLDAGWLAFIQDPTGGHVGLWQRSGHFGADIVNEPGSLCWNELATRDIERAKEFYGAVFDWGFAVHDASPTRYYIIQNNDSPNGGLMQMDEQWGDIPPHWSVYFAVEDVDAVVERVKQAGGAVCVPAFDTPVGRMSVVNDPQGALFSLIALSQPAD